MIYVLSHADSDGRFAAWCAYSALKEQELMFFEVQYDQDFPIPVETLHKSDSVYILDFSYKREILEAVNEKVGKLVVLDHHKSARDELAGLSYAHFDITKSGALLAWEYFNPGIAAPRACVYINDRDLWTKQFPESTYLESYLRFKKIRLDWKVWDLLTHAPSYLDSAIEQGKKIKEMEDSLIDKVFYSRRHYIVHEHWNARNIRFAIYNCPGLFHSEVAEKYYTTLDVDYTIGWRVINDGETVLFNLRSPGKVDVSQIAKTISKMEGGLSGGGHASAAGATMKVSEGLDLIKFLLSPYQHIGKSTEALLDAFIVGGSKLL